MFENGEKNENIFFKLFMCKYVTNEETQPL